MNAKSKSKTVPAVICGLGMMLALAGGVRAAQDEATDAAPAPPGIAESGAESGAEPRAESEAGQADEGRQAPPVRIYRRQEFGQTITEYERGGRVFLMTVKPKDGPTQYWDDLDRDGQFQRSTSNSIDESMNLPKWRLGSW